MLENYKPAAKVVISDGSDQAPLGELITRENIDAKLGSFAGQLKIESSQLAKIWYGLVGHMEVPSERFKRKITHVEKSAMEEILRHYPDFSYGLMFDNLPPGFYLQKQKIENQPGQLILRYDARLVAQHKQKINPLTLIVDSRETTPPSGKDLLLHLLDSKADREDFLKALNGDVSALSEKIPHGKDVAERFDRLMNQATPAEAKKEILIGLIVALGEGKPELRDKLTDYLNRYPELNASHLTGIGTLLAQGGLDGVAIFFARMEELKEKNLYQEFRKIFLDNTRDFTSFTSPEGLKNLDDLMKMNAAERNWWVSMVRQHHASGARTDFNDLFGAFRYFIDEIKDVANMSTLPSVCPFDGIKNMKLAMNRALFILNNAIDKEEQVLNLDRLDFSQDGAYYASRYQKYKLVTSDMRLSPARQHISASFPKTLNLYGSPPSDIAGVMFSTQSNPPHNSKKFSSTFELVSPGDPEWGHLYDDARLHDKGSPIQAIYKGVLNGQAYFVVMHLQAENNAKVGKMMGVAATMMQLTTYPYSGKSDYFVPGAMKKQDVLTDTSVLDVAQIRSAYAKLKKQNELISGYETPRDERFQFLKLPVDVSYAEALKQFYRVIGLQKYAYPLDVYKNLIKQLNERTFAEKPEDNEYIKINLLQVMLMATTGPRALEKMVNPEEDFRSLMDAFAASQMNMRTTVVNFNQEMNQCSIDAMPTFRDLISLMKVSDTNTYKTIFGLVKIYGDAGYAILDMHADRLKQAGNTSVDIKPLDLNNFSYMAKEIQSDINRILKFDKDPALRNEFIKMLGVMDIRAFNLSDKSELLLFKEKIAGLPEAGDISAIVDDSVVEEINTNALATHIAKLDRNVAMLLLSTLSDIDIAGSSRLPALDDIVEIVKAVAEKEKDILKQDAGKQKEQIRELVQEKLPQTKIGKEPVEPSLENTVSLIKGYIQESGFIQKLTDFYQDFNENRSEIESVPIFGKPIINKLDELDVSLKKFSEVMSQSGTDADTLLKSIRHLDESFESLLKLAGRLGDKEQVNKAVGGLIGATNENDISKFISDPTIWHLIHDKLVNKFENEITMSLRLLRLKDDSLLQQMQKYLGKLPLKPTAEELDGYNKRFVHAKKFCDLLIREKRRNEDGFRQVVALYEANQNLFALEMHNRLWEILGSHNSIPLAVLVKNAYDIILKNNNSANLERAFTGLETLVKAQKSLSREHFMRLLEISLQHNLTKESPFPLAQFITVQTLDRTNSSISREQCVELFENLTALLGNKSLSSEIFTQILDEVPNIMRECSDNIPSVITFSNLLLVKCREGDESAKKSLDIINTISKNKENHKQLELIVKILVSAMQAGDVSKVTAVQIESVMSILIARIGDASFIQKIASLYQFSPAPGIASLDVELKKSDQEIDQFISRADKDPSGKRTEAVLKDQFSLSRVKPVLKDIQNMFKGSQLSEQQQFELASKLVYINDIGCQYPIEPVPGKGGAKPLIDFTRSELRELARLLTVEVRGQDERKREIAQLQLLAVMREVMYRAEKDAPFPYSTQILSVLISLQYPDNLIMQINTGEGKGITTALLAAMQHALGQTVDVCTANKDLAERDYEEHLPFFQMLGIETSIVRAESEPGTYKVGGINYSTVSDMSLYRSRAKLEGEKLRAGDGGKVPVSLILDESDYALLDDKTLFNYATSPESGSNPFENTYAWIYPLINEFIDSHQFGNIDAKTGEVLTEEQDVIALKKFLHEKVTSSKHKLQLKDISDRKLDKWINAACSAKQLKEGTDFTVQKIRRKIGDDDIDMEAAIPLIDNIPQPGSSYSNGVHQFLHARLQAEKTTSQFPIDAEMLFVASESAKNFVDYYNRKGGRIVGISGTVGTLVELKEQKSKFGLHAVSIPPHNSNQRQYEPLQVKKTSEAHVQAISDAVNSAASQDGDRPPILMICENASEAHQLLEQLKARQFGGKQIEFQLVTGNETEAKREEMIRKAGGKNVITISTSLMGRGTNIKPPKDTGLHVIQTYLDTSRTTQQIIGRSARNGMIGKYSAIYDRNNIVHRYNEDLGKLNPKEREDRVKAIQKRIGEEAAVERYYVQEMDGIKNVLMKQYGKWNKLLLSLGIDDPALAKSLLAKREELITEIEERWNKILNASDPNNQYSNPYIRRGPDGRLDHTALDECLKKFEAEMQIMWEEYRKGLQARIPEQLRENKFNKARIEFLEKADIGNELKARKLTHHTEKRAQRKKTKMAVRNLDYALDPDRAYLEYSRPVNDEKYSDTQQKQYAVRSCYYQLKLIITNLLNITQGNKVTFAFVSDDKLTEDVLAKNIEFAILLANKYASDTTLSSSDKSRLYPVLASLDSVVEMAQKIPGMTARNIAEYQQTRKQFLDQSRKAVVSELLASLAWTQKKNAEYYLERGKVRNAAGEVYRAAHTYLNAASDSEEQFNTLVKVLMQYNGKLDNTFTLSMGHISVRSVIDTAISRLGEIQTRQEIEKPETKAPNLLKGAQEKASLKRHIKPLRETISRILKSPSVIKSRNIRAALIDIEKEINAIIAKNQTVTVFDEIIRFVKSRQNGSEAIRPYLTRIISQAEKCKENYTALHPHVSHQGFLKQQEADMRTLLKEMGWEGKDSDIMLSASHNGFREHFELRVAPHNLSELFKDLQLTDINPESGYSHTSVQQGLREEKNQLSKKNVELTEKIKQLNQDKESLDGKITQLGGKQSICKRLVSSLANLGQEPLVRLDPGSRLQIPELREPYNKLMELEEQKKMLLDFRRNPSRERLDQMRKENKIPLELYSKLSGILARQSLSSQQKTELPSTTKSSEVGKSQDSLFAKSWRFFNDKIKAEKKSAVPEVGVKVEKSTQSLDDAIDSYIEHNIDGVMKQCAKEINENAEKIIKDCQSQIDRIPGQKEEYQRQMDECQHQMDVNDKQIRKLDQQISVLARQEEKSLQKPRLMVKRFENVSELMDFMKVMKEAGNKIRKESVSSAQREFRSDRSQMTSPSENPSSRYMN